MSVVLVAGTHSWDPKDPDWHSPGSPFVQFLMSRGVFPVFGQQTSEHGGIELRPFVWSTDLGGVSFGDGDLRVWLAAGLNLYSYIVPPLCPERRLPVDRTNIIAHSHGLQVVLVACRAGLKINTLISVGSPIRKDMDSTAKAARPNIKTWVHIHSDGSDRWQVFGSLFDGRLGIVRKHPLADINEFVPKVGHTDLLRDPDQFHHWQERGWLEKLR